LNHSLSEHVGPHTFTLADVLPAPAMSQVDDERRTDVLIENLGRVFSDMPIEVQEYAASNWGLNWYQPVKPATQTISYSLHKSNLRKKLNRFLLKDIQLQGLVQRETCVL
jgi:hypothetical protein